MKNKQCGGVKPWKDMEGRKKSRRTFLCAARTEGNGDAGTLTSVKTSVLSMDTYRFWSGSYGNKADSVRLILVATVDN